MQGVGRESVCQPASKSANRRRDGALVEAARSGDQRAYARLMALYTRPLTFHVSRLLRSREPVDDLVQEVFLKAFDSLSSYHDGYAFSTWLYRIATNHTIDYLRKKKLSTVSLDEPVSSGEGSSPREFADAESQADKPVFDSERQQWVARAVERLPEKYRKVIVMRHMDELSYEEISEALELPLGTVKAHLFRARELLNKALRDNMASYF